MFRTIFPALFFVAAFFSFGTQAEVQGQEPSWYPRVIAPPEMRPAIQATPVELRPYRPLHFWGNTVRRTYYRGSPMPLPKDILQSGTNLLPPLSPVLERPIANRQVVRRFSR